MKWMTLIFLCVSCMSAQGKKYPISDHYNGKVFTNPDGDHLKTLVDVFKWKWSAEPVKWPESTPNKNYKLPLISPHNKGVLTFVNHATFLIQLPGVTIITDPVFANRASPVGFAGPKRARQPGISFETLPPIQVVLISHNHYDHLDLETLVKLEKKFRPLFIVPLGNEQLLKSKGLGNVIELDWWQEYKLKDTRIILTPAAHWSSRSPWDKNETLWGGYVLANEQTKIFFAGDTGYGKHFLEVKTRLGAPDFALLPIGAYLPRDFMKAHHMNPEDAVMAHQDLGSPTSFGMHFGTFQLTDEGMEDPVLELEKARGAKGISADAFRVLDQGQSHTFN